MKCNKIRCKYLRAIKSYLEDKWFDIKYFFVYNVKMPLLGVSIGIKNFWKYKSVIYKDRWFDYSFILTILKFKLEDTIENWTEKNILVMKNILYSLINI